MGKHGPCYHCGATSTPLWRNGPPEKPVLCNACGSRWRTKGSLTNYTPLHARTEHDDLEDCRMARLRAISIKNKEARALKRKQTIDNADLGAFAFDINPSYKNFFEEDTSNRSSSGSAISYSESCAQFGGDASDFTVFSDPAQTTAWDSTVPSRKRTCVTRPKQSSVEKLTKDLYTILHEQPFSWLSGSSEDELLYETDRPMVSVEIGHGSVLIRHPNSIPREEESEASSLSVDNKLHPVNEAYSPLTAFPLHSNSKRVNLPRQETEKFKKPTGQFIVDQDQIKSDQLEKLHMLSHHDSPLQSVCLKDVVNFDEFSSRLTREEQLQLHKYLPSIDTCGPPESLKRMFQSQHLEESLHTFQKLLGEGVFDNTLSEMTTEDSRMLKSSVLCDLTKSRWVEQYSLLKDVNSNGTCTSEGVGGYNVITTGHPMNAKKIIRDRQGEKNTIPKRSMIKVNYENLKVMENNDSGFCQKALFSPPDNNSSIDFDSFAAGYYDQDLLLDVPSNNSFPQAELLLPSSSFVS